MINFHQSWRTRQRRQRRGKRRQRRGKRRNDSKTCSTEIFDNKHAVDI